MKTYHSAAETIKRTLLVEQDIARMKVETLRDGKWNTQNDIVYTHELVKGWGFPTLEEFVGWKIKERGMMEVKA